MATSARPITGLLILLFLAATGSSNAGATDKTWATTKTIRIVPVYLVGGLSTKFVLSSASNSGSERLDIYDEPKPSSVQQKEPHGRHTRRSVSNNHTVTDTEPAHGSSTTEAACFVNRTSDKAVRMNCTHVCVTGYKRLEMVLLITMTITLISLVALTITFYMMHCVNANVERATTTAVHGRYD